MQLHRHAAGLLGAGAQVLQGLGQPESQQRLGHQVTGHPPQLANGAVEVPDGLAQQLGGGGGFGGLGGAGAGRGQVVLHGGQHAAEAVVQVAGQAAALLFLALQNCLGGEQGLFLRALASGQPLAVAQ